MTDTIGFIGLGLMGAPMAASIIHDGHDMILYNRTTARALEVARQGARVAATPAEVGSEAEVVFVMLTGPEAIDALFFGPEGLFAAKERRCQLVVNMSTVPPSYNRELAERLASQGVDMLEAMVCGSTHAAETGSLVILTAGAQVQLDRVNAQLRAMARQLTHCGEVGRASTLKMAINQLLAIFTCGMAEASSFAERNGLSSEEFFTTIFNGPIDWGFFEAMGQALAGGDYPPGFPAKHMLKDLGFVARTASSIGAPIPLTDAVGRCYEEVVAQGLGNKDFAAIKKIYQ